MTDVRLQTQIEKAFEDRAKITPATRGHARSAGIARGESGLLPTCVRSTFASSARRQLCHPGEGGDSLSLKRCQEPGPPGFLSLSRRLRCHTPNDFRRAVPSQ